MKNDLTKVNIYTDGACSGNPGPGGWGAILECGGVTKELSGGAAETTNNRMELTAAIEALSALKRPCQVTLTTDSHVIPMEGFLSQVAVLMKHGLTEETAYKCVTIRAAKALDLADELGSIEPGKAADVVIWESEPFKAGGRPRTVLINGKIQYQTEN